MSDSGIYDSDYEDASDASESLYAESPYADSPADGYFSQRDHPPETFIEQSSVQGESEAKAREAAASRSNSSPATPPSQTSPTTSTQSPIWVVESTALFDAGPAPPDYAAATADRTRNAQSPEPAATSDQNVAATPTDYGSIARPRQESPPAPPAEQTGAQWPLGNRGNPFGADFPYGPRGSPFGPNFPFGPNGHPLANQAPRQSMQDAAADHGPADEETALVAPKRSKHSKCSWKCSRRCCKPSTALNYLLILLVVGLVVLIVRATRETSKTGVPSAGDDKSPPLGDGGGDDDDGSIQDPANGTLPTHPRNAKCAFTTLSKPISFDYDDPENFSFTELMEPSTDMPGGISGNIFILPAPADQDQGIRVWVSFATPEPWHVTDMTYRYALDILSLHFPKVEKLHSGYAGRACMDVAVGIYVRSDIELGDWSISTANLNVEVAEGLFSSRAQRATTPGLWLANTTTINAVQGNVNMAYWSSRETKIDVVSGSVHGTYALRDVLSIRSHSGSIGVKVSPEEADPAAPTPAEFTAISYSGSVDVGFPMAEYDIPDRDYRTRVESHSSSISGSYIHGSATSVYTTSGSISVDILPHAHSAASGKSAAPASHETSTLHTESHSGTTNLRLLSPINEEDRDAAEPAGLPYTGILTRLRSAHKSASGSLNLVYPQEWEGTIEGWTISGSLDVTGKDVYTHVRGSVGPAGKHLVARKGFGSSRLDVRTTSGSVGLRCGEGN
ncbi:hypothetical protein LTR36_009548 [Oleoguttula mirabilis]|uniref:Adhesin domain-containing protein n=1 Tax=Oleoguttula mirabilis TaxID=1507867 RepID=A0AAV9JSN2_9PEZI|nr:hypothetical protein LTR36_009548 [Oleoguttula mirabilis]